MLSRNVIVLVPSMCMTIVDGAPILNFGKAATQGVVWDTIILSGALLSLSTIMMTTKTGIGESLLALLNPIFAGKGPISMCGIIFVIAVVLTNFMANTTVGLMFTPVIFSFGMSMGFDPLLLIAMLLISIHVAFLTPAASPFASLLFGNTHWVKPSDIYKFGTVSVVIMVVIFLVVGIPLSQLMF